MLYRLRHIKEDSWVGRPKEEIQWECQSDEECFLKLLKENNKLQKSFRGKKESYELTDFSLADKYDAWWCGLSQEEKDKIFDES